MVAILINRPSRVPTSAGKPPSWPRGVLHVEADAGVVLALDERPLAHNRGRAERTVHAVAVRHACTTMMCREAMASCRQVTRVVAIVWEPLRCIVGRYDQDAVNATCVLLAVVLKFCIAVEAHLVHPVGRVGPTVGCACIELVRPLQLETPRALELHAWTGMQQVWRRAVDPHRRRGGRPCLD